MKRWYEFTLGEAVTVGVLLSVWYLITGTPVTLLSLPAVLVGVLAGKAIVHRLDKSRQ